MELREGSAFKSKKTIKNEIKKEGFKRQGKTQQLKWKQEATRRQLLKSRVLLLKKGDKKKKMAAALPSKRRTTIWTVWNCLSLIAKKKNGDPVGSH